MITKSNKGFLIVAENNNYNFVEMAYMLAKSIKKTQKTINKVSIIITDKTTIEDKHKKMFYKIIKLPKDKNFRKKSKSLDTTSICASYYSVTPYDETIVLDADFLFTNGIEEWWKILSISEYDLVFTSNVYTYKNHKIKNDFYRKFFTENKLPSIYTGMFYFKKNYRVKEFFDTVNNIFNNWELVFSKYKNPPSFLSADVAYSIAYQILNFPDMSFLEIPKFTHMKTRLQDITKIDEKWTDILSISFQKDNLKIENFLQILPFHYHDKTFWDIAHEKI